MATSSPAQNFAAQLLAALAQAGAQRIFLAPGARSQSLAIAAGQLAEAEAVELVVRLDERGVGFAALGAALASGERCQSGLDCLSIGRRKKCVGRRHYGREWLTKLKV